MEYKGFSGQRYVLNDDCFGKGGEGRIYDVLNFRDAVAKLYKRELCNSYHERKLITMLQMPLDPEVKAQLAWPKDLLRDQKGNFVGFVMPKVLSSTTIGNITSRESGCDMKKRITVAKNLCVALYGIHRSGLVVGDLNENNVLVNTMTAMIKCIDTDSFHITNVKNGRCYRSERCVPEYLDPMIGNSIPKGETLKTVPLPTFTQNSDEYALAVLIFQLLMNGTHPFAVALAKGGKTNDLPSPTDLMRSYRFPYGNCPPWLRLPIYALSFKTLSERLRVLFVKVFSKKEHIPADFWYSALCEFEKEITKTCKVDSTHKYRKGLRKCPYCEATKKEQNFFKSKNKH